MRRAALLMVGLAVGMPATVGAQAHPNFSGTWNYQAAPTPNRDGRGGGGGAEAWGAALPTLVIRQTPAEITLEAGSTKWVYKLDGTESVIPDPGNKDAGGPYPYKTKAKWDGTKLLLYTRQGLNQMRDILTMNGAVLNITRDTEMPAGSGIAIPLVYNKTP
jgi:hypothetical protein